jgi:hypothetical protein
MGKFNFIGFLFSWFKWTTKLVNRNGNPYPPHGDVQGSSVDHFYDITWKISLDFYFHGLWTTKSVKIRIPWLIMIVQGSSVDHFYDITWKTCHRLCTYVLNTSGSFSSPQANFLSQRNSVVTKEVNIYTKSHWENLA